MAKNPFGKSRKLDNPYAIFTSPQGWEWRVLKTYKNPANEPKDQYARWFVAACSPHTYGEFELGDTYRRDVLNFGLLVAAEPEWLAQEPDFLQRPRIAVDLPTPADWIAARL